MRKKIANLLRRWANKLSPDAASTDQVKADALLRRASCDVKTFRVAKHYSRQEIQEIERNPDYAALIDMDSRRRLLDAMGLQLYQAGAIAFHTEPECCPDSHDVLIATCRAVVVKR